MAEMMDSGPSPTTVLPAQQAAPRKGPSPVPNATNFPPFSAKSGVFEPRAGGLVPSSGLDITGQSFSRPARIQSPGQIPQDIKAARSSVERGLSELRSLQQRRYYADEPGLQEQIRFETNNVLADLKALRAEVSQIILEAESHRWRKWLAGGLTASLIPAVRTIWRRPSHDVESSNDTEYAFRRSDSLIRRVLNSVRGLGGLATFTFFIFAVVYIFRNEVLLRVGKTVSKRLRRLATKVERGEEDVGEADLRLLGGWRWRVLVQMRG